MAAWDHGYVTDIVYTRHTYRETTPNWLATAALLLGHRPPDLTQPFRYVDLGCGHGLTANFVAATFPNAEVWAFDFNPAHIESGRQLAAAAGLTNIQFREAAFADLAALPHTALPEFDFVVSHGVLSWISRENRAALLRVIDQRLRPGGLVYLSYNVPTGWASMVPIRGLMRLLMQSSQERTDQAASGVLDYLDMLKDGNIAYLRLIPLSPADWLISGSRMHAISRTNSSMPTGSR
jgi:SAM-dependent methyltransferase